ncbi:hypothetical protein CAC42_2887 [Sphaceloma murrayae]|uniref:GP-PDE domain-containing protein n=1 Tax=Sphaceloma murrayae TaxID=2082308 RepID=A0A2K1R101_9PEZI|nr:hypothetical protein CAC42_2887 [Sphaceloma murrayae]
MLERNRYVRIAAIAVAILTVSLYLHLLLYPAFQTQHVPRKHSRSVQPTTYSGRQPYDVRKIIDAFRQPHDDLVMLCAYRGLRWNGTAENPRDSYFRAAEAGIECIETDLQLSKDNVLLMVHDDGVGRTTDVGERDGRPAYNPFTGQGHNPRVDQSRYTGDLETLHLRDEAGRVRVETIPTLADLIQMIHDTGINIVLQLDFKDKRAVEPAYWALKNLTNAAGVPANEWCIYKLQAAWYQTAAEFEALAWVKDAFSSGVRLAYIPVYEPEDFGKWDQLAGVKSFLQTNYTISIEIERRSSSWRLQDVFDHVKEGTDPQSVVTGTGVFFPGGDFIAPISSGRTFWDTSNYSLPEDARKNNSVFVFEENSKPQLLDWLTGELSFDGHDYRQDFNWLMEQGYNWVIADNADSWSESLSKQGKRNVSWMIMDGKKAIPDGVGRGWYQRK